MPSIHVIKSSASAMPKDKLSQPKETFSVFNDGDSDDLLEDLKKEKKKQTDKVRCLLSFYAPSIGMRAFFLP
ncbi:hypothetical protein GTA08_BOTSDO08654 [Neofusicoccum parvum]|nr:hypothetical protein GTA08_BOTSDO08654 [Neofusicoccum parvum]